MGLVSNFLFLGKYEPKLEFPDELGEGGGEGGFWGMDIFWNNTILTWAYKGISTYHISCQEHSMYVYFNNVVLQTLRMSLHARV